MEQSPGGSLAQTLTYNTLIKGLGRELRVDEAFDVARGMLDRGCIPNEVLCAAPPPPPPDPHHRCSCRQWQVAVVHLFRSKPHKPRLEMTCLQESSWGCLVCSVTCACSSKVCGSLLLLTEVVGWCSCLIFLLLFVCSRFPAAVAGCV